MDYFRQYSCLETNPCMLFLTTSLPHEEAQTNLELDSLLSRFYGSVWTKKSMNGMKYMGFGE